MAGLGRRSHYRKHLTDSVLNDLPEPDETLGQRIARVVGTRGGNMFDIVVAPLSTTSTDSSTKEDTVKHESEDKIIGGLPPTLLDNNTQHRTHQLAFLPTKFRKLVWIKRNDFVIVQCGEEEDTNEQSGQGQKDAGGSGFRYVITHILYKDQVKHIKTKGLWPEDPFFADEDHTAASDDIGNGKQNEEDNDACKDADVDGKRSDDDSDPNHNETSYNDDGIVFDDPLGDEYMINTNRVAKLTVEDSSSEEESD